MRLVRWSLVLTVVALAGCALAGAVFTRNTLHVPRRHTPSGGETVEIRAKDGAILEASFYTVESSAANSASSVEPRRCLMIMHGVADSRGSAEGFAQIFRREGYTVLTTDSCAHGDSGGDTVTYGLLEKDDTLRWAKWLRQRGCARLYGLGESLGGSVLLQAAAIRPEWEAIVTESAYAELQDAAEQRLRLLTASIVPAPDSIRHALAKLAALNGRAYARLVYRMDLAEASPSRTFAQVKTPVLLIHGLADDQTTPDHSRRLAALNPRAQLWLVDGVRHESAYNRDPAEYRRRVLGWFAQH